MTLTIRQGYNDISLEVEDTTQAATVIEAVMPYCKKETSFTFKMVINEEKEEQDD